MVLARRSIEHYRFSSMHCVHKLWEIKGELGKTIPVITCSNQYVMYMVDGVVTEDSIKNPYKLRIPTTYVCDVQSLNFSMYLIII